jgi:hypothetical protein
MQPRSKNVGKARVRIGERQINRLIVTITTGPRASQKGTGKRDDGEWAFVTLS